MCVKLSIHVYCLIFYVFYCVNVLVELLFVYVFVCFYVLNSLGLIFVCCFMFNSWLNRMIIMFVFCLCFWCLRVLLNMCLSLCDSCSFLIYQRAMFLFLFYSSRWQCQFSSNKYYSSWTHPEIAFLLINFKNKKIHETNHHHCKQKQHISVCNMRC